MPDMHARTHGEVDTRNGSAERVFILTTSHSRSREVASAIAKDMDNSAGLLGSGVGPALPDI
jgi:hypothetical protein